MFYIASFLYQFFSLSFTFASVPARVILNNRYPARGVYRGVARGGGASSEGGHLLGRLFWAPPGVNYLDTGTLQDTGHLLGGGLQPS